MERLVNAVIQASKNKTDVQKLVPSHFGVFYWFNIMKNVEDTGKQKIFYFSNGKIVTETKTHQNPTLPINRTKIKGEISGSNLITIQSYTGIAKSRCCCSCYCAKSHCR
jgi:hypothetical protein